MLWVPPLFALMKAGEDLCRPPCRICRLPPSRICSADHSRFLTSATTYFLWSQISQNGSILFVVGISTNVILSHPRTEHLENPEPYVQISKYHCYCYHHHHQHHVHHHHHHHYHHHHDSAFHSGLPSYSIWPTLVCCHHVNHHRPPTDHLEHDDNPK